MNAATEFDIGPLTWVKSEIDLALERADGALQQYTSSLAEGPGDLTQIKFCRTFLHQVQGALTIIGLDGVMQFAEAIEAMLDSFEKQACTAGQPAIDLAQRGLAAIGRYLDDLIDGQPNQPLRLLPLYGAVQKMRGIERVQPSDLFFPDLGIRPPRRAALAAPMAQAEFQRLLRQERARFQRGLLSWLLDPQNRTGVSEMLGAVKRIEATQDAAAARSFWWVSIAFLCALAEGSLPTEPHIKQLCARIDLQIRRLLEGSKNVAERLMRDALYCVAQADSKNSTVQQVKETYRLHAAIPPAEDIAPLPHETLRRKLRDVIAMAEESWNKYCAGTAQSLPVFREQAGAIFALVEQLGHTDYRRLTQAIVAASNWLAEDSHRHSDALAMEIATAILLTQNAQENFQRLGSDFAHQVDVMVARMHACIAGTLPQSEAEIPLLDEMSRKAQEKMLIGQVAKEIQSNLAQIEQVLDTFFRDVEKRADLATLDAALNQCAGALTMMRHDGAVASLRECATAIKRFSDPAYVPQESDFEQVANQLSVIGFFVDAMQHGTSDFATFVRQMQPPAQESGQDAETPAEEDISVSVEQEVAQQKEETLALLDSLRQKPDDAGLREEIRHNLTALKSDADLVADAQLGNQAKAMLSALETGEADAPQIEQVMASLKPHGEEIPTPSAETVQLAQSSSEEIDAELLGIFLEEAREVLTTIEENLQLLNGQPHNVELLTTIRRSFHTLKGSGRMVGLKDVGEAAWAVEQTLNLWLRQEMPVTAGMFNLIAQAHAIFSAWVVHLETRTAQAPDPRDMIALAESLRQADTQEAAPTPSPDSTPEQAAPDNAPRMAEIIPLNAGTQRPSGGEEPPPFFFPETIELTALESEDSAPSLPEEAPSDEDVQTDTAPQQAAKISLSNTQITLSPELFNIFFEEAKGHLSTLQREISALEDEQLQPTPHDMYRAAHTLGGIAGTLGIVPLNQLGLALERTLLRRDSSAAPGSLEALGVIRQAIDAVDLLITALCEQRELALPPGLIDDLDALYPLSVIGHETAVQSAGETPPPQTITTENAVLPETAGESAAMRQEAPFLPPLPPLQDDVDEQLLAIFLEEAVDLNRGITEQLRLWHENPADGEAVRILTRLLHTLKGSARMAGAMNLGEITHAIETRVEEATRAESVPLALIDEIDSAFDDVQHIIERLQAGESLTPPETAEQPPAAPGGVEAPPAEERAPAVAETAHEERRADRLRLPETETEAAPAAQRATLRVRADLIDRLTNDAGELSIARARIEGEMRSLKDSLLNLTENVIRLRRQLRDIEIQAELQMQSRTAQTDVQHAGFDPLEFDRFTRFQELTRMMAESVNDVGTVQQNLLKNLDDANAAIVAQARLNREVQQALMSVRMVPFGSIADRLYRIVRQTAKELNKRAHFEISGSQVELDRSVLDKMAAPLEHMLRNAIAHGLEDRATRLARGKAEIGEIALALKQEGNEILLSFSDDGGGLDYARIRQRAVDAGLLGADEVADENRLAGMIFMPGFSTASEISQISGRGVGMDVVKTEVTSLGGRLEVVSRPGQGTEFLLYIPLTLAVTKALLVRAGSRDYAIPSVMIEQVLDLKEVALNRIREAGAAEWMGHHYPFSYLPHLLGEALPLPEKHRQYWVLLLRSGTRRIAVLIDELRGNREIVVKNIGPQLARVIGIDGATVLGDGQVLLILNPVTLSSRAPLVELSAPDPDEASRPEEEPDGANLPTVMVVDDSLTVRKITGRLLAREGYQVLIAKDGVEALEQLAETLPDVMLVDIEMPRMDGFDLTRNVRADARLKHIPIIMITSRTAEKHRTYAFGLGVNNYLGKPYQEDELLRLIAGHIKPR